MGLIWRKGKACASRRQLRELFSVQAMQCSPTLNMANACCSLFLPCSRFLSWAVTSETSTRWERTLPSLWILYRCSSIS